VAPGFAWAWAASACSAWVISFASSSTPPEPKLKGGLIMRPEIAAKPLFSESLMSGSTTPGKALSDTFPAPPTANCAGIVAVLRMLWHSRHVWLSRPFMRRNMPLAPSDGRPPGDSVSLGFIGPSPRPSSRLNGVAKIR
jgi:hypothetical protein